MIKKRVKTPIGPVPKNGVAARTGEKLKRTVEETTALRLNCIHGVQVRIAGKADQFV